MAAVIGGVDPFLGGITDLDIRSSAAGDILYTTTRPGTGGIAAYRIEASGSLTQLNQVALPASTLASASVAGVEAHITASVIGGTATLLATGTTGTGLWSAALLGDGRVGSAMASPIGSQTQGKLAIVEAVELGGQTYYCGSRLGSTAIEVWRANSVTGWQSCYMQTATSGFGTRGLTAMESIAIGNDRYLLTASDGQSAVTLYQLASNGQLSPRSQLGMDNGLWVTDPSVIRSVTLAGQTYAIVAGTSSNSLSVVQIDSTGAMKVVDHLIDTRDARFAGVCQLETITMGGRVFLTAAGSDDGISLFQLLPGGRLLHLTALADANDTTLQNISGLALLANGNSLRVIAASGSEPGLTVLQANFAAEGRQIIGSDGSDFIQGGAGQNVLTGNDGNDRILAGASGDVLLDGPGRDTLTGGAGEDIFILSDDDTLDQILAFDPGRDWIDLSNWSMLRNVDQLTISTTSSGATVRFGYEVLSILTSSGTGLSATSLRSRVVVAGDRILPDWFDTPAAQPDAGIGLTGSSVNEMVMGTNGSDRLEGQAGNDTIMGLNGDDTMDGGRGADQLNGGHGSDVYIIDNADDLIIESYRWRGYDEAFASVNYSINRTHVEKLTLVGNARLGIGNVLENVIIGTGGNDTLDGGSGNDTQIGGRGDDLYILQNLDDVTIELPDQGFDIVKAYRSTKLGANIENIYLQAVRDAEGNFIQGFKAIGNDLDNVIVGNPFDNELTGREGNDTLRGHYGDDVFIFDRDFGADNIDHIVDFTPGDDTIGLKASLFALARGALDPGAFRLGTAALDSNDRILYDRGSGNLWVDLDGRGGAAPALFAVLDNHTALSTADFLVM